MIASPVRRRSHAAIRPLHSPWDWRSALSARLPPRTAQAPPCANEFVPLRQAVEAQGLKVKAAVDRKADRGEVCNQLKAFASAEAKFVKYIDDNQSFCGIPPQAVQQLKTSHTRTLKMRGQACAAGAAAGPSGPKIPAGPGLAEALGTTRGPFGRRQNRAEPAPSTR